MQQVSISIWRVAGVVISASAHCIEGPAGEGKMFLFQDVRCPPSRRWLPGKMLRVRCDEERIWPTNLTMLGLRRGPLDQRAL